VVQISGYPTSRDFTTRLLKKQYNAVESYSHRTLLFAVQEAMIEASAEDCWVNSNLLGLAAGGAALHWFRT
jgi:hypothetical protein